MKQWGGNQSYRPEKKDSDKHGASRAVPKKRAEKDTEAVAKTERDYRVGRTIAGATNNARKRNLEHIALRKKQARKNAVIVFCVLAIIAAIAIILSNYVATKIAEREQAVEARNPVEPTVTIVDESTGNNISSRVKVFVARLEADAKDYNIKLDHVVLPFQKARELWVYFEGRDEYYKMTTERGSTVQIEDAERMIRYLDSKGLKPSYVDLRVEGNAYYK